MQVKLMDYTGFGSSDPAKHAAALLIFTKSTRLQMEPDLFEDILTWDEKKVNQVIGQIARTNPGSWEFISLTFLITGVTRAFTHQLVRTRTASFAQQTMRVLHMGTAWTYGIGPTLEGDNMDDYVRCMGTIQSTYNKLVEKGAKPEDARGVLPTNIHTNIVMKVNLRTFVEMFRKRRGPRTQGEYRDVLDGMVGAVMAVYPWVDVFLTRDEDLLAKEMDELLDQIPIGNRLDGSDAIDEVNRLRKLIDEVRQLS